jgi:hypothetical protein
MPRAHWRAILERAPMLFCGPCVSLPRIGLFLELMWCARGAHGLPRPGAVHDQVHNVSRRRTRHGSRVCIRPPVKLLLKPLLPTCYRQRAPAAILLLGFIFNHLEVWLHLLCAAE